MLVYTGFFDDGGFLFDDLGDHIGILAIAIVISPYHNGLGTHAQCQPHRHSGMHAKLTRFIRTGRHYPTVAAAADEHGYALELAVLQALHRYKKGIEITMYYTPFHVFQFSNQSFTTTLVFGSCCIQNY
ncbi:hypothetical protein D3C80_1493300 [compost metagenome]